MAKSRERLLRLTIATGLTWAGLSASNPFTVYAMPPNREPADSFVPITPPKNADTRDQRLARTGDILFNTNAEPQQIMLVDPETNEVHRSRINILSFPVQAQLFSKNDNLMYKPTSTDILSIFVKGQGGPGTAAKAEGRMRFTGILAIGGYDIYGAAVQTDGQTDSILLFEAYGASHHQGTIYNTPRNTTIEWLGWGGISSHWLFFSLSEEGRTSLYKLDPTFPDLTPAKRDCYYSSKPATDCMIKIIKAAPRKVVKVAQQVKNVWVAAGEEIE